MCCLSRRPISISIPARCQAVTFFQAGKAALAAATARSTSGCPPFGTASITSSVAGSTTSMRAPLALSAGAPSIQSIRMPSFYPIG